VNWRGDGNAGGWVSRVYPPGRFNMYTRIVVSALALAAATLVASCGSDAPTDPQRNVLAGLELAESNDTVPTVPPPQAPPTPGFIHGFVLGFGTGPDTMATAPRLADVVVTAYPLLGWTGNTPQLGSAVAVRNTDATGHFEFSTLAGGEYVVTFVPPPSSAYRGSYVTTRIHSGSSEGTWWVFLPFR
jgi:hypothetical protein